MTDGYKRAVGLAAIPVAAAGCIQFLNTRYERGGFATELVGVLRIAKVLQERGVLAQDPDIRRVQ